MKEGTNERKGKEEDAKNRKQSISKPPTWTEKLVVRDKAGNVARP